MCNNAQNLCALQQNNFSWAQDPVLAHSATEGFPDNTSMAKNFSREEVERGPRRVSRRNAPEFGSASSSPEVSKETLCEVPGPTAPSTQSQAATQSADTHWGAGRFRRGFTHAGGCRSHACCTGVSLTRGSGRASGVCPLPIPCQTSVPVPAAPTGERTPRAPPPRQRGSGAPSHPSRFSGRAAGRAPPAAAPPRTHRAAAGLGTGTA